MASLLDRCMFVPTAGGTADFTVSAAVTGYMTPAQAGAINSTTYYYGAESSSKTEWEVGLGTYSTSGPTLARTTVLFSSNANAKVNFSAAPNVFITLLAENKTSSSEFGLVKVDGTTIQASNGVISGGVFPVRPPTTSLFSLSNNGTSVTTSVSANTRIYTLKRTDGGTGGADRIGFQGKSVPVSTPWTAMAILQPNPLSRNSNAFYRNGLALVQNSSGKTIIIVVNTQGNVPQINVQYYSDLNTFSSNQGSSLDIFVPGGGYITLRVGNDGTNLTFDVSFNFGLTYTNLATLAIASFFTPDRVGLVAETFATIAGNQGECSTHCVYYTDPDFP